MLKVDVQKKDSMKKELTVTVPPDKVKKEYEQQYKYVRKNVVIPGFRKGKAPLRMLKKQYGEYVEGYVKEELVSTYSEKVFEEHEIHSLTSPNLIDSKFEEDESFTFQFSIHEMPEFELKPHKDYKATITVPTVEKLIEQTTDIYRRMYSELEPIDGEAQDGDILEVDYKLIKDDGEVIEDEKNFSFDLGSPDIYDEFNDNLKDVKSGDTRKFPIQFPKDFDDEELAGKECIFEVIVNEVKRTSLPEIDEELVTGSFGFESLDQFNELLDQRGKRSQQEIVFGRTIDKLIESLLNDYDFEVSDEFVEHYLDYRTEVFKEKIQEENKEEILKQTKERVKVQMILRKIAQEENIFTSDEELNNFIFSIIQEKKYDVNDFIQRYVQNPEKRAFLVGDALHDKILITLLGDFDTNYIDDDGNPLDFGKKEEPEEKTAAENVEEVPEVSENTEEPKVEENEEDKSE